MLEVFGRFVFQSASEGFNVVRIDVYSKVNAAGASRNGVVHEDIAGATTRTEQRRRVEVEVAKEIVEKGVVVGFEDFSVFEDLQVSIQFGFKTQQRIEHVLRQIAAISDVPEDDVLNLSRRRGRALFGEHSSAQCF